MVEVDGRMGIWQWRRQQRGHERRRLEGGAAPAGSGDMSAGAARERAVQPPNRRTCHVYGVG